MILSYISVLDNANNRIQLWITLAMVLVVDNILVRYG